MKKFFSKTENWVLIICVVVLLYFVFFYKKKREKEQLEMQEQGDKTGGVESMEKNIAIADVPTNLIKTVNDSVVLGGSSEPRQINTGYTISDDEHYKPASDEYNPLQFIELSGETRLIERRNPSILSLEVNE